MKITRVVLFVGALGTVSGQELGGNSEAIAAAPDTSSGATLSMAIPDPGRFRRFFQPFRTELAALSPDGQHIAYTVRDGENLFAVVVATDDPGKIKTSVLAATDATSTPMMSNQRERTPARVRWMRWVGPSRVVLETNRISGRGGAAEGWRSWPGAVFGFDADGGNARQLAGPNDVPEIIVDELLGDSEGRTRTLARPDQPAESARANVIPDAFTELTASDELQSSFSASEAVALPRALRVFDLDAKRENRVTVLATGSYQSGMSRRVELLGLDASSGKLKSQEVNFVSNTADALLDRQGRARITLPSTVRASFPFHYKYSGPKGKSRERLLSDVADAEGFNVSPRNFFGERSIPVGFDENPDVLYYASNVGRDTFGIYGVNLTTKQRGSLVLESPLYDLIGAPTSGFSLNDALVFDRYDRKLVGVRYERNVRSTAWLRPELAATQEQLEALLPGRSVELVEWDRSLRRVIFATEGPADPGAFYLFDRETSRVTEFVRRSPWIDDTQSHPTLSFGFETTEGRRVSGLITVPKNPRLKPIPLVVLCPRWPWDCVRSDFSTEVQSLADMGFAVAQFNSRGAWGLGRAHREAIGAGYDLVQVEDLAYATRQLEKLFAVDLKRVALLGFGHGGFIALRAVQDYPELFRCAIAVEAPVDLDAWLNAQKWGRGDLQLELTKAWLGDDARLAAAPLVKGPERIKRPLLVLNFPGLPGELRETSYLAARRFAEAVRRHGGDARFEELPLDYMRGLPQARGDVFAQLEEFLNLQIYDFNVKLRGLEVVD